MPQKKIISIFFSGLYGFFAQFEASVNALSDTLVRVYDPGERYKLCLRALLTVVKIVCSVVAKHKLRAWNWLVLGERNT